MISSYCLIVIIAAALASGLITKFLHRQNEGFFGLPCLIMAIIMALLSFFCPLAPSWLVFFRIYGSIMALASLWMFWEKPMEVKFLDI